VELLTAPLVAPGAEMSGLRQGEPAFRLVCDVGPACLGDGTARARRILRGKTISSGDWACAESWGACGEARDKSRWKATHDLPVAPPG